MGYKKYFHDLFLIAGVVGNFCRVFVQSTFVFVFIFDGLFWGFGWVFCCWVSFFLNLGVGGWFVVGGVYLIEDCGWIGFLDTIFSCCVDVLHTHTHICTHFKCKSSSL